MSGDESTTEYKYRLRIAPDIGPPVYLFGHMLFGVFISRRPYFWCDTNFERIMNSSFYLKLDLNILTDFKVRALDLALGSAGFGVYVKIILTLADNHGKLLADDQSLAMLANVIGESDVALVRRVIEDFDLFVVDRKKDTERPTFFSARLLRDLEDREQKQRKAREYGKKGAEIRYGKKPAASPAEKAPASAPATAPAPEQKVYEPERPFKDENARKADVGFQRLMQMEPDEFKHVVRGMSPRIQENLFTFVEKYHSDHIERFLACAHPGVTVYSTH